MRKQDVIAVFLAALLLLSFGSVASAQQPSEFQVILMGNNLGALYGIGAEFGMTGSTSVTTRAAGLSYSLDDDGYTEDGSGVIIGGGVRFYAQQVMEGMYFGAGLDYVSVTVDWYDYPLYGTTEVAGVAPNIMIGYKAVYDNLSIEPSLLVSFISVAGTENLDTSVIAALGVSIGFRF